MKSNIRHSRIGGNLKVKIPTFVGMTLLLLTSCTSSGVEKVNVVDGHYVEKPNCPDWSSVSWGPNLENTKSSNFGCSTVYNFGEMVLDKTDLVEGKSAGSDVSRSSLAVTKYRTGQPYSTTSGQ
jgi:type IV pilus biogenesis protein CpaD/CtpE